MKRFALALLLAACGGDEPPPPMAPIGEFTLVDQSGAAFGRDDLRGSVWVGSLIFTSCPDVCPVLSSQLANVHRRLTDRRVRYVSFTVDPIRDTPAVLREYAGRFRADLTRWTFLTGEPAEVRRTIGQALHLPAEERREGSDSILHFDRFFLVDSQGTLRGLYETDAPGLARLERDAAALLCGMPGGCP